MEKKKSPLSHSSVTIATAMRNNARGTELRLCSEPACRTGASHWQQFAWRISTLHTLTLLPSAAAFRCSVIQRVCAADGRRCRGEHPPTCTFTLWNHPYFQQAVLAAGGQSKLGTAVVCNNKQRKITLDWVWWRQRWSDRRRQHIQKWLFHGLLGHQLSWLGNKNF